MFVLICKDLNGSCLKRRNAVDNRLVEYAVLQNKNVVWLKKEDVLRAIMGGQIKNAVLRGNTVVFKSENPHIEKITSSNYTQVIRFVQSETKELELDYSYPNWALNVILKQYMKDKQFNSKSSFLNNLYVAMYGNSILGLYSFEETTKYTVMFESYFKCANTYAESVEYKRYKRTFVCLLSKLKKNSVFFDASGDTDYLFNTPLKKVNTQCSFNSSNTYCLNSGTYFTEYDENIFVQDIEASLFPNIELVDVKIKLCDKTQLQDYFEKWQMKNNAWQYYWEKEFSTPSAIGFTYLSNDDLLNTSANCLFLVAYAKGVIVGVLKLSLWDGVRYIEYADISEKYWNTGVLTKLLQHIDTLMPKEEYLITTMESLAGKKIKISEKVKKIVRSRKVMTRDEFSKMLYSKKINV